MKVDAVQIKACVICFGMQVERLDGLQHMHIPPGQTYKSPGEAYVEGDASSASYFLAGMCGRQCLFTLRSGLRMQAGPSARQRPCACDRTLHCLAALAVQCRVVHSQSNAESCTRRRNHHGRPHDRGGLRV